MSEPITPEWLRGQGFQRVPCHVHGTPGANWWHEDLQLEIWQLSDGPWVWREADSVEMRTRAAVAALMHWMRAAKSI
jgi:hypothetical protein